MGAPPQRPCRCQRGTAGAEADSACAQTLDNIKWGADWLVEASTAASSNGSSNASSLIYQVGNLTTDQKVCHALRHRALPGAWHLRLRGDCCLVDRPQLCPPWAAGPWQVNAGARAARV